MKKLWTGPTRVYFNAWEEGTLFWSVDRGPGTPELKTHAVILRDATLTSIVRPERKEQPRAWFEGSAMVCRGTGEELVIFAALPGQEPRQQA